MGKCSVRSDHEVVGASRSLCTDSLVCGVVFWATADDLVVSKQADGIHLQFVLR